MAKHHHAVAAAFALCSAACNAPEERRELTDEEWVTVQEGVDRAKVAVPFMIELAKRAAAKFVFSGKVQSEEQFIAALQTTLKNLQDIAAERRMYAYREGSHGDAGAHYQTGGAIGLNLNLSDGWGPAVYLHEAAHSLEMHGPDMALYAKRRTGEEIDSEFVDKIAQTKDLAYLVTLYADVANKIFYRMEGDLDQVAEGIEEVKTGTPGEYVVWRIGTSDLSKDKAEWIEDIIEDIQEYPSFIDHREAMELTPEEIGEALEMTDMYEYGRAEWEGEVSQLRREIMQAKMRESAQEFRGRKL